MNVRGGAIILVSILLTSTAYAQDAPEPIKIDYEAPAGCPSRTSFAGEIFARTSKAREASNENARVMHVRVERRGETHAGRLWFDEGAAREVAGGSCGEVVGALGLVAALAVDPEASMAPRPAPAVEAAPATTEKREPERPPPPPPAARSERTRFGIGVGVEAAMIANAVGAGRVLGEIELPGALFAPAFRVAVARSLSVDRTPALGTATLVWTKAAIDACPLRFDLVSDALALRPCAGFDIGVLRAEGSGVTDARSRSRPWMSTGAHARLVWSIASAFSLEVEGGLVVPLFRENFFFDPNVPIYEAPPIAGLFRGSAVVRFP